MVYFGYCTLLSVPEMKKQCPSARLIAVGQLDDKRLAFASYSENPRLGGCTYHDALGSRLLGALYDVPDAELERLHEAAGVGKGWYSITPVTVLTKSDEIPAITYLVEQPLGPFAPADKYVAPILEGARSLGLPGAYTSELEDIIRQYQTGTGTGGW